MAAETSAHRYKMSTTSPWIM